MRSFAVVAGFAAVALAAPHYEVAPPAPMSSAAGYPVETPSSAAGYPVETPSSAAGYPVASSAAGYPVETPSSAAGYPVSSAAGYPVASSAPAYTTTEVISATTYVCPEETTITYGPSTYTVSKSGTLSIPQYTATYVASPPPAPAKSTPAGYPVASASKPAYTPPAYSAVPPAPHYPATNGSMPSVPAAQGTATGTKPTATKPATPEFSGAAGKATVGFFAVAGAVAAFL